jgi:iron complex outermembrane recepter protein
MRTLQRQITAAVLAQALWFAAGAVHAQAVDATAPAAPSAAPEPTRLEEIVVTGIRASHEQSLIKKREADSLMEVITAEDIGKLPDKNVADAVQRVPGVNTMSGSGGEGGFSENDRVSIRGTNPSLTQTTVNGHMISSGDWYIGDQTNTVGRSVSFTLLPSEIVSSVEVQKSSQADYIEGGTSGNVNIVTRAPLDFKKKWTFEATAQALYADLPQTTDPQVNALVNWKNDAGTMGALFQLFSEFRHERRDGQELFLLGEGQVPAGTFPMNPDLDNVVFPSQIGSAAFTQHSRRQGGLFDVQFKPDNTLSLDVNGFYSHFNGTNFDTNFMASPTNELLADVPQLPGSYRVINGTLVSASFPAQAYDAINDPYGSVFPGIRDSIYRPNASSSAAYIDFDTTYKPSDKLLVTSKIGFTQGIGWTPHDYGYEAFLINSPLVYQMNGTGAPANVSFPGLDPTNFNDPNHVVNGGSWHDSVRVTDSETYAQADALWTLDEGVMESAKFGVRLAYHQRSDLGENYGCNTDPNALCNTTPSSLPKPAWYGTESPSNFGAGIGAGPGFLSHFWVMDPNAIVAWETAYNSVDAGPNYQGEFKIAERDAAVYAMANFAGSRWRGNAGVRLVNTSQYSSSYNLDTNNNFVYTPVTHDYFDVLPSINFKYDVSKSVVARFAASRTMSRADYSALSPAVILNNIDFTGTGGNSDLKPIRSNNLDADVEWYYAPQSLLSFGVFTMNLPSYVTYGYNTRILLDTSNQKYLPFVITSPFNIAAVNRGYELSWQQPLGMGFGALANYTYADGHSADGAPLVGSSKTTWNAEAYYENKVFSARLAYTYRSSFLVGLANVTAQYAASLGTLAASVNYKITDNVAITFDGLNLNNPIIKYYSNDQQPQAFYSSGRQYFLGLRVSL